MRTLAAFSVLLSVLTYVSASPDANISEKTTSRFSLPATFRPPQVFRNVNLVHVISLEKNYVKESINVLIENVGKEAQDEYFLPFSGDQMSRVGGVEVKDRKNADAGPFTVEAVDFDVESDIQYYRIRLPSPLGPGDKQTLGISYYLLKSYAPLPALISQDDTQFLAYSFSAYAPSAYTTTQQKTEVKFPSSSIADYTKLPGSGNVGEFPQKQGSKLTYGPFDEKPAGASETVTVRFEFNKPVSHVSRLERDIEVSHWGGNVAFEERYTLFHRGANLSSPFNRAKWAHQQFFAPQSHALKDLRFPLPVGSTDAYFTDAIGNVSTSRFRSNKREALLEIKPRYPLFGGWKYPFTIGWNADTKHLLRRLSGDGYILNVPFLDGPKQSEGIEYEQVEVRVILPEAAENVKYYTTIPQSSITETNVDVHKTYLDTLGRTVLVIKARNLVDDFRDRELIVSYDYPTATFIHKPVVVFMGMMVVFFSAWILGGVEVKFSSKK